MSVEKRRFTIIIGLVSGDLKDGEEKRISVAEKGSHARDLTLNHNGSARQVCVDVQDSTTAPGVAIIRARYASLHQLSESSLVRLFNFKVI